MTKRNKLKPINSIKSLETPNPSTRKTVNFPNIRSNGVKVRRQHKTANFPNNRSNGVKVRGASNAVKTLIKLDKKIAYALRRSTIFHSF